jgi:hypothetical protein
MEYKAIDIVRILDHGWTMDDIEIPGSKPGSRSGQMFTLKYM